MHPRALLQLATELTAGVLRLDRAADRVVSDFFRARRSLGQRERATLAETAYAVLRRRRLFEHLAHDGPGDMARRLAILGFAAPRQLLLSALDAAERDWLARCDRVAMGGLPAACRHNLPDWLAARLQAVCGPDFDALAAVLLQPAPLDLRVNALQMKRGAAREELATAGIDAWPVPRAPLGLRVAGKPALQKLDIFRRGAVEVQDEGSQLVALLLDARRGSMVADFCAGAGGKTLAIGAAMRSSGTLYAFDVGAARLEILKQRVRRSGLTNVHPIVISEGHDPRLQRLAGKLDRVLVDAPCSGLGTLRRNPDLKWRQDAGSVARLAAAQSAILARAARLLKAGGQLVYATCSLLPEENEEVAAAFSAAHPGMAAIAVADLAAGLRIEGARELCTADGQYLRLWPHRHHTDGFFAAAWRRET